MNAMYRFIKIKSDGTRYVEHLEMLRNAYRLCIPEDQTHWHIKMWPAFLNEFNSSATPYDVILVSYDDTPNSEGVTTACYIQSIPMGPNTPYPTLNMPLV